MPCRHRHFRSPAAQPLEPQLGFTPPPSSAAGLIHPWGRYPEQAHAGPVPESAGAVPPARTSQGHSPTSVPAMLMAEAGLQHPRHHVHRALECGVPGVQELRAEKLLCVKPAEGACGLTRMSAQGMAGIWAPGSGLS